MKRKPGEIVFDVVNVVALLTLAWLAVAPVLHTLFASVTGPEEIVRSTGLILWPRDVQFDAYRAVLSNRMIGVGYINTIFYVVVGTGLNIVLTSMGAYGLSRRDWRPANFVMMFVVVTMFFQGGLIPLFLVVRSLGLLDTRASLILPTAVSAWNLIIMRTYFRGVPQEIVDSARIDGAPEFTILLRIFLPIAMPVVAVILLFYGVFHWNSWFSAAIFLRSRELVPLQLVLREILIANEMNSMVSAYTDIDDIRVGESIKFATIVVATVPILTAYPFLQRYFVKGITVGAIKG